MSEKKNGRYITLILIRMATYRRNPLKKRTIQPQTETIVTLILTKLPNQPLNTEVDKVHLLPLSNPHKSVSLHAKSISTPKQNVQQ